MRAHVADATLVEKDRSWRVKPPARLVWPAAAALGLVLLLAGTGYRYAAPGVTGRSAGQAGEPGGTSIELGAPPRGVYIVIDRTNNRLYLRRGDETLLEAVCSAGSGSVLRDPNGDREWIFDTPTGVFHVRSKITNPIWRKPDWAFIEAGEPIPQDSNLRFESDVLGEYALDLGDGYLIHGTIYERLLGRSVTHGCIRLGRDDLRKVVHATRTGTPVYIF